MKLAIPQQIIIVLFLMAATFGETLFGNWTMMIGLGFDIGRKAWVGVLVVLFVLFWLFMPRKKANESQKEQLDQLNEITTCDANAAEDAAVAMMESAAEKARQK